LIRILRGWELIEFKEGFMGGVSKLLEIWRFPTSHGGTPSYHPAIRLGVSLINHPAIKGYPTIWETSISRDLFPLARLEQPGWIFWKNGDGQSESRGSLVGTLW
jgi:hypothetical protein